MQRMGMVIGLKPEKIEEYKSLHANAWPEILDQISKCKHPQLFDLSERAGKPAVRVLGIPWG